MPNAVTARWVLWGREHRAWLLGPLVVIYFLAAKLGLQFAFFHASASAVWPPTGIALAAVLLFGVQVWPAIFVGAFLANLGIAGDIGSSLGIAAGNALEAIVGGLLVERHANGMRAFDRAQDYLRFVVLGGLVATTISATIGVMSLALAELAARDAIGTIWLTWWLGDAAGALIVAPAVLLWGRVPVLGPARQRDQVHARGWRHQRAHRRRRRRGRADARRQRHRPRARPAAARFRPVHAGAAQPRPRVGRTGHRPDAGATAGAGARRADRRDKRRPSKGCTFAVRLPHVDPVPAAGSVAAPTATPGRAPRRILIIEDDADGREALRMRLELAGHRVYEAATGPEGIETAARVQPDVVLLDIGLPGADGYEVASSLKSADRCPRLIAITGHGQPRDHERSALAGIDRHLVKPIDVDELDRLLA
jgi:CheY-like chemotaxis protein